MEQNKKLVGIVTLENPLESFFEWFQNVTNLLFALKCYGCPKRI